MTIHSEHPFVPPERDRSLGRRLRGRLVAPVTLFAHGTGRGRVGLTVSSVMVIDGEPVRVIALIDPDSDLGEALEVGSVAAISLCHEGDQYLADAFAGIAPAPGGLFRLGEWLDTRWGPVHVGRSWFGARVEDVRIMGWSAEIVLVIEHIELIDGDTLSHFRGKYRRIDTER